MATQYVPNKSLNIARNLRFIDANGNDVQTLFAINPLPNQPDTPQTGYISLIGANVSTLIDQYNGITTILNSYNGRITSLESNVQAILTSGATSLPNVNGGCFSGNTSISLAAACTYLINSQCSYNSILGTPTDLANAVLAQCSGLNTAPAFSQNSDMSGLSGWISTPLTLADTDNNQWKAICDLRGGMTTLFASVSPTCSQVIVAYQATLNSGMTFNLYFRGYSFIPSGFTDNGSTITITDDTGNLNHIYQTSFNIVTASNTTSPVVVMTSGSTLSPTSTFYTVTISSSVVNSTLGLSCQKSVIETVYASGSSPSSSTDPDIGNYTAAYTSGTTSITLITGLDYTPRYVAFQGMNTLTTTHLLNQAYHPIYTSGGAIITFDSAPTAIGVISIDWIAFR